MPPARELRDLHKDLWIRFGKEESSTIKRLASVQERLKQQQVSDNLEVNCDDKPFVQASLAELEEGNSGPTHPIKVERVKYLTREIQVRPEDTCSPLKVPAGGYQEDQGLEHRAAGGAGQDTDDPGGGG